MKLRSTSRLLTALLLILAAFGAPGSSYAAVRLVQVTICAADRQPGSRHSADQPATQPAAPPRAPQSIRWSMQRVDEPRADQPLGRDLFQRPPPSLLVSSA